MYKNSSSAKIHTPLEKGFEKLITPFQQFIHDQTTSSILLIISTVLALIIANSSFDTFYNRLVETNFGIYFGNWEFSMDLVHWINEALMTFFFFLLGMEVKRELLVGEISEFQRLAPIIFAALGGMLVPASIYYLFNAGSEFSSGWGIPMATDTAFAVGVLALLAKHIPRSAFVFLTALAIFDDLGAILVIALFYSHTISVTHIGLTVFLLSLLIFFNILGIRKPVVYFFFGFLVWISLLGSGIHATIAGILVAISVPARPKRKPSWFLQRTKNLLRRFEHIERNKEVSTPMLGAKEQHEIVENVQDAAEKATTPLRRWENFLEKPIALFILPIFALANAGIPLSGIDYHSLLENSIITGIVVGLVIGKGMGIPLFTWLAIQSKLGILPSGLRMKHIIGIGLLSGMGFTMSIFIASLGFEGSPEALLAAKSGILVASLLAGICGYIWLRVRRRA